MALVGAAAVGLLGAMAPANAEPGGDQVLHPDTGAAGTGLTIGIVYQEHNHGGYKITFKGGRACTATYGDIDYKEHNLVAEDFVRRTSSVEDFNGCDTRLYQDANPQAGWVHSGGADGWFNAGDNTASTAYNLADWDNRAEAIWWS